MCVQCPACVKTQWFARRGCSTQTWNQVGWGGWEAVFWCKQCPAMLCDWDLSTLLYCDCLAGQRTIRRLLVWWSMNPLKVQACVSVWACAASARVRLHLHVWALHKSATITTTDPQIQNIKDDGVYLNSVSAEREGMIINCIWTGWSWYPGNKSPYQFL